MIGLVGPISSAYPAASSPPVKKKFDMDKATEVGALIIALSPIALAMFLILNACQ